MRQLLMVSATLIALAVPSAARAQDGNTSVQGFGGVTFGTSSVLGTSTASTFGGSIAAGLSPNVQIVGEVGRLSDIKPPLLELLDFTPFNLRVSAWYGEACIPKDYVLRHWSHRPLDLTKSCRVGRPPDFHRQTSQLC